jgi:hypothetical protein
MNETDNLGSFLKETKALLTDYIDTKIEIYRLLAVRSASCAAGFLLWITIITVLVSLFIIFLGLVTGFWLSEKTGSYRTGFGITAGLIAAAILLICALRRPLFINPMIRTIIQKFNQSKENNKEEKP